ncbi:MAG: CBS domain-containing protein [Halanaerobiaceae bacterium]
MLTAKDVMTTEVVTIPPDTSVEDAAKIMSENEISGLPVVENDHLLGIVSEKDLIMKNKRLNSPGYINILDGIIFLESPKKFEKEFRKFIAIEVEDLMTRDVITVKPETTLDEIATIMVEEDVNRLPVVENDKLIGIVTRGDVVREMAKNDDDL